MRSQARAGLGLSVVLALAAALAATPAASAGAPASPSTPPAPLVVIVARDSPLVDLPFATLRALFSGEPVKDPSGRSLLPINHPPGATERVAFDRRVLGMSPEEVGRFWVDRRIRGQGRAPRIVEPALVQLLVARLPGAVSYARADRLDPRVKVVTIDGRGPAQSGYALKE